MLAYENLFLGKASTQITALPSGTASADLSLKCLPKDYFRVADCKKHLVVIKLDDIIIYLPIIRSFSDFITLEVYILINK